MVYSLTISMAQSAQAIVLRGMALAGSAIAQGISRLEDLVPGFSSTKWHQILHARHQLVRFPNPLASGHSWQLGNLTTFKSTFLIANEKKMYLSASSCCSCPCTQVLRLMYSGLRWRSLERKLRSCLREGRGAEVWGGGGSGARGARGQAAAQKGGRVVPFSQGDCPPVTRGVLRSWQP